MSEYKLKKLIKTLAAIKGRHTELVSVYIPSGFNIHETINQLKQEQSTAENIKSKSVRKNVVTALEKIQRHLQLYKKTPPHGLAVFCGNVSEREGVSDIELWAIEPPQPIRVKLYWCDQRFDLTPLEEMVKEREIYGIVCMDKSEADIAIVKGKKIVPLVHFESIVPGKTRAGGQSSQRFARVREGLLRDWYKHVAEAVNKIFSERDVNGIMLSGPGPIKDEFFKGDFLHTNIKEKILGVVDTSYTGEHGLHETIERGKDILKGASITKEKKILQRFFDHLQRDMAVYGLKETMDALEMGAVDTLIITETLDAKEIEYECECGLKKIFVFTSKEPQKCEKCGQSLKLLGEKDIIEAVEERVKDFDSKLVLVSNETREGKQFEELGGIGAILRYRI